MSMVGGFPRLSEIHRMTTRQPINPLDVSTIFSILPLPINERKITIMPNFYHIDACEDPKDPTFICVQSASWWKELDEKQPLLEITVNSMILADAIVKDYCNGMLGFNGDSAKPGLFYVPGRITVDDLKSKYLGTYVKAIDSQSAWYKQLVKLADALWSRTNGNPLAISDIMRLAARQLGLNKEWMQDFQMLEQERCKACGTFKSPLYPVCPTCKAVTNPDQARSLKIEFAQF